MFEILGVLAVIMQHGEIQRVDALEIFGVERVLGADAGGCFGPEVGLEQGKHRAQNVQVRNAEFAASRLQPLQELRVQQGVEHDSGRSLHLVEDAIELALAADKRVNVLDRSYGDVLGGRRASDRDQRLAGRVGDKVKMKIASGSIGHAKPGKACG